jgi:hypothetical protein
MDQLGIKLYSPLEGEIGWNIIALPFLRGKQGVNGMSKNQAANEVKYKVALKLLDIMLRTALSPSRVQKNRRIEPSNLHAGASEVYA